MHDHSDDILVFTSGPLGDVPMLREPGRVPGKKVATLSPVEFYALTRGIPPVNDTSDAWGLFEEPLETIDKGSFQLFTQKYSHPKLAEYSTGDRKQVQAKLRLRYDRALAARDVLEEVEVGKLDEQGRFEVICVASTAAVMKEMIGKDELIRERNAQLRSRLGRVDHMEEAYKRMTGVNEAVERHFAEQEARERLRARVRPSPSVATPITPEDEERNAVNARYRDAMKEKAKADAEAKAAREEAARAAEEETTAGASTEQATPTRKRAAKAKKTNIEVPETPQPPRDSGARTTAKSLGNLLGGRTGYGPSESQK